MLHAVHMSAIVLDALLADFFIFQAGCKLSYSPFGSFTCAFSSLAVEYLCGLDRICGWFICDVAFLTYGCTMVVLFLTMIVLCQ